MSSRSPIFPHSTWEEDRHTIAQANIGLDADLKITEELVSNARGTGNFVLVNRAEVDFVDVGPKQLVSVAASLVPFLEHDGCGTLLARRNGSASRCRCWLPRLRWSGPVWKA